MSESRETFRFGDFELDVAAYELRRNGRAVRLERHPMDLLLLLVERRNDLVSRADIVELLWGKDVFVDVETGVHTAMRKIRQALRDSADAPQFVETVPGRGYRFIAAVEVVRKPVQLTELESAIAPAVVTAAEPTAIVKVAEGEARPPSGVRRRAVTLVALLVVLVLGAAFVLWRRTAAGASSPRITLAVLPFQNIGNDSERQYLADGLTEETSASLAQIDPEHLSVRGRTLRYKGTTKSVAEIGQELAVDYLLESTIQSEGSELRVTAKLIRVRDQEYVWTQSFDQAPTNLLGLQRQMSAAIAEQIRLRLSPAQLEAVTRRQPRSADAYDLYLRGWNFQNQRTPATSRRAIEYFERATALDPNYALAWAGISLTLASSPMNGDAPPVAVTARAREAAFRAVRADPELALAQYALAYVEWMLDWDWPAAERGMRTAIALDPDYAKAHVGLAHAALAGRQARRGASDGSARAGDRPSRPAGARAVVAGRLPGRRLCFSPRAGPARDRPRRGVLDRPRHARPGASSARPARSSARGPDDGGAVLELQQQDDIVSRLSARERGAHVRGARGAADTGDRLSRTVRPAVRDGVRHPRVWATRTPRSSGSSGPSPRAMST